MKIKNRKYKIFNQTVGFSIIELLVSISIFSIILLVMVSLLFSVNSSNSKTKAERETQENARRIMDTIIYEIKGAKSIYTPATTLTQLSLETTRYLPSDETNSFIDFFLCGLNLCFKKESQNPVILNSDSVEITSLSFGASNESADPLSPSTVNNDASDCALPCVDWIIPESANLSDNVYASIGIDSNGLETTSYLKATGFGFNIPIGATINGILVEWEVFSDYFPGLAKDHAARIVKGGTIGSTDRSNATDWSMVEDTFLPHGSSSDLWGDTWTSSDINSSNFGAAIKAVTASGGGSTPRVDSVRITVFYTSSESDAKVMSVKIDLTVKYKNPSSDPANNSTITLTSTASLREY